MTVDILTITKEVIDLFAMNDLTRIQSIFVLEAVKMSMQEDITKEIVKEFSKGNTAYTGVQ